MLTYKLTQVSMLRMLRIFLFESYNDSSVMIMSYNSSINVKILCGFKSYNNSSFKVNNVKKLFVSE